MLIESASVTNWRPVSKLKRPGAHLLAAPGSWPTAQMVCSTSSGARAGARAKLHGAVVDHVGHEHTRVFGEVAAGAQRSAHRGGRDGRAANSGDHLRLGEPLGALDLGRATRPAYRQAISRCYRPLWEQGITTAVIDMDQDFSRYRLLIAPMLYMVRPGVGERIERFVESGGTFIATYWSGIVDENDLCFLGGFPGPLRRTLGIWSVVLDALHDGETNRITILEGNTLGLAGSYECYELCDLIHLEGAEALAVYQHDFYAGRPALTVNCLGAGKAYYVASRNREPFFSDVIVAISAHAGLPRAIKAALTEGVTAQVRTDGARRGVSAKLQRRRAVMLPTGSVHRPAKRRQWDAVRIQDMGVRFVAVLRHDRSDGCKTREREHLAKRRLYSAEAVPARMLTLAVSGPRPVLARH